MYVFNDVVESDDDINPKSVICSEPLITPLPNLKLTDMKMLR